MCDDRSESADTNDLVDDLDKLESLLEDIEQSLLAEGTLSVEDIEMFRKVRELCQCQKEVFKNKKEQG